MRLNQTDRRLRPLPHIQIRVLTHRPQLLEKSHFLQFRCPLLARHPIRLIISVRKIDRNPAALHPDLTMWVTEKCQDQAEEVRLRSNNRAKLGQTRGNVHDNEEDFEDDF